MNSIERRELRYQRRKAKRKEYVQPTYDEVFSYEHLYESYKKCIKGVKWKGTVQRFILNSTAELHKLHRELIARSVKTGKFHTFTIMERGKTRHIKSVSIRERIVQRCNCDYFLVPLLGRRLITDNFACQKGKGYHQAIRRVKRHLKRFYLENGKRGYILQFDFSKYFDTIPHKTLIGLLKDIIKDKDLYELQVQLIEDFEGDYGLGLGSQISQISALFYPSELDITIKEKLKIKAYGRYMDDGYLIFKNKKHLDECLNEISRILAELEIILNKRKTQFIHLSSCFTFLKAKFNITDTGKIIVRPVRKSVAKNRRKLRKFRVLLDNGDIDYPIAKNFYTSVVGRLRFYNSHKSALSFKHLFCKLFKEEIKYDRQGISL